MLGSFGHNIFNGSVDYFNKGFIYAACKDIIRAENVKCRYKLKLSYDESKPVEEFENIYNDIWKKNYDVSSDENKFYMWCEESGSSVLVTKVRDAKQLSKNNPDIIGEFDIFDGIKNINTPYKKYNLLHISDNSDEFKINLNRYYDEYDTTIYGYLKYKYYGTIECNISTQNIEFTDVPLVDVCDIEWNYNNDDYFGGYKVDVSKLYFKSESIQNILINMGVENSVISIEFYADDGCINNGNNIIFKDGEDGINIKVDTNIGNITIESESGKSTEIISLGDYGESIENLKMNIVIKDQFDTNFDSLAFKDYFSVFNQLSIYNISKCINNDYNIKYYSTVEDNKYKIRVIDPESIGVEDIYESVSVNVQNNKNVIGSVEIREKENVDKIGIKIINRHSGFYNPIFNDILYFGDYTYTKSVGILKNSTKFELPYSNTNIDYNYSDAYGNFGVIKNMYYHKTNTTISDKILSFEKPVYPLINEYALDYRDYNIFSSSWDEGYFISQDNLDTCSICEGIGSMKESLCMFGSKYLNLPDSIFIDTFENGKVWDDKIVTDIRDNTDIEIMYKEINDRSVIYYLFIEKRLKRYLKERLINIFSKYINKYYSFGNKGTIEDDVDEYVEKNLLKLYKVDRIYMYIKSERMGINNKKIENEYLNYIDKNNDIKIKYGFPFISINEENMLKDSKFIMGKINEFDRTITYNLKPGFKESFGFGVSFRRK
jgi:hypothetical protein